MVPVFLKVSCKPSDQPRGCFRVVFGLIATAAAVGTFFLSCFLTYWGTTIPLIYLGLDFDQHVRFYVNLWYSLVLMSGILGTVVFAFVFRYFTRR